MSVSAGRRDLNAVRSWVLDAASALPQSERGQRMLLPIVQRGIGDLAEIVARSNGELGTVGGRVRTIGAEYAALGDDKEPIPGKAVRPLDGIVSDDKWKIARSFPTLLDEWSKFEAKGWHVSSNSGGTYTDAQSKIINIDLSVKSRGSEAVVNALSHERLLLLLAVIIVVGFAVPMERGNCWGESPTTARCLADRR